jgi:DNA-binding MarR family transcriptional regulator
MNEIKPDANVKSEPLPRLGEIGLSNFAPYLMNRIMGRYNADLRQEMSGLGLTTPKMRALAVLSVIDALPITELAVYAVVEQSTLSRALDQLTADGLVRRDPDPSDSRVTRIASPRRGRAALDQLWPSMSRDLHADVSRHSGRGAPGLRHHLQKMLKNIRKHDF